jgi:hypothetical protein
MTVPDAPSIKITGQGSRREASRLGETIGAGVARAVEGRTPSMNIETLRVRVRAGASQSEIDHAIRLAIDRQR